MENKTLLVDNQLSELRRLADFLDDLGEEWELNPGLVFSLNLVLEEALTNIILYGFQDTDNHSIEMEFSRTQIDQLVVSVIDDGHPYDPTQKEDPDLSLPAEERPVGGLGIFLIKKIMDKVEYNRNNNKNFLILTKNIKS